jgi:hypothetical protein
LILAAAAVLGLIVFLEVYLLNCKLGRRLVLRNKDDDGDYHKF